MKIHRFEVSRGLLQTARACVLRAANTAYERRDEIDFYCPEETQFMACNAAMLQRFRHELADAEAEGDDCLFFELDERERLILLEVLTMEIEINLDLVEANPFPETLRELAYQLELFDMVAA